jgi:hypothetical protein
MKIGTTKTNAAKFIIILNIKNIVRPESSLTIILSLFPYNRALEIKAFFKRKLILLNPKIL